MEAGILHVYARGNEKRDIFRDDVDLQVYTRLLGETVVRQRWHCLAYCLMPNHVHLLIETVEPNLGAGMRRMHGVYAQGFNRRHDRVGHLFQGRYGAVRVTSDEQLMTTVGYIATNPVTAGLVAEPAQWTWSSHRALADADAAPRWLAATRLGELLAAALGLADYRRLVADRLGAGVTPIASEVTAAAGSGSTVL